MRAMSDRSTSDLYTTGTTCNAVCTKLGAYDIVSWYRNFEHGMLQVVLYNNEGHSDGATRLSSVYIVQYVFAVVRYRSLL